VARRAFVRSDASLYALGLRFRRKRTRSWLLLILMLLRLARRWSSVQTV
jgi:hypothetical protein